MLKGKGFDNLLKFSTFFFWLLALWSICLSLYNLYTGYSKNVEIGTTLTFMFFAFLSKYQYAIQYWLNKLEIINKQERERQLGIESNKSVDS